MNAEFWLDAMISRLEFGTCRKDEEAFFDLV